MKNLIKFVSVLLLASPVFAGDFVVGGTAENIKTIYVQPISETGSCLSVSSAEVTTVTSIVPKPTIPKQRVCRSNGFETVTIVGADGEETQMERPLPFNCEFCHRDSNGSYINCTETNSTIVEAPDYLVTDNMVELEAQYEDSVYCDSVYIAIPVTPGQGMTITMPDSVESISLKQTLGKSDTKLENVNYINKERVVPSPARIAL